MPYRWKVPHRQFKPGDAVPESYPAGVLGTLLERHRIEPVTASPDRPKGRRANRAATQHGGRD